MDLINCESCGMPTDEKTASKFDARYCIYCQDQETARLKSRQEVEEGSIKAAVKFMGKTEEEAREMVAKMLPNLPRWKSQ